MNKKISGVAMKNVSNDGKQKVISFQALLECNENELEETYKTIIGKILGERNVIVVSKKDKLIDLICDGVKTADRKYLDDHALQVVSFTPRPESNVEHIATLVKKIPLSVIEDLAISSEFIYGNLWFLVSPNDKHDEYSNNIIEDVRKLTPSGFKELPLLKHEVIALPAMYDGLEILWFNPDDNIYRNIVEPLF